MSKASQTRLMILQKAFELMYAKGYQATSIDEIIATTKVTKGAFFYHFKNKDEMGLAVINEVMFPATYDTLVKPLLESDDPVHDIYAVMHSLLFENSFLQVKYGCPAGNFAQEMSPLNVEFATALSRLVEAWQETIQTSIRRAKRVGKVNKEVNARQVAIFVAAGYWGIRNYAKMYEDNASYTIYLKELKRYLASLK